MFAGAALIFLALWLVPEFSFLTRYWRVALFACWWRALLVGVGDYLLLWGLLYLAMGDRDTKPGAWLADMNDNLREGKLPFGRRR
jgi:hypothetical protein